jgi:hypothetical protein
MSESNRLPYYYLRRLLPDLVSVEKRNGICLVTDFFSGVSPTTRDGCPLLNAA